MIRFLRNLVLFVILLAAAGYLAAYLMRDRITAKVESILTDRLIAAFGPGPQDHFGYNVRLHFYPPVAEVTDLGITSGTLRIGEDTWNDCDIRIRRLTCDLLPLLRFGEFKISSIEGIHFTGRLSFSGLADYLERNAGMITNVRVDTYGRKARIRFRFGNLAVADLTMLGQWGIDERKVVTVVDREYLNPDSPVPEGMIRIIEEQSKFDVRVNILGTELVPQEVFFNPNGLAIAAQDQ
jgi:hypothetical protein